MQIALVPYKVPVDPVVLARVAAALHKQVRQDFGPLWHIDASVSLFLEWQAVPPDYVRLILVDQLDSGALGVHANRDGVPYSLVAVRGDWPIVASHECLEMLADPAGNRTLRGPSPIEGQGEVELLVEVCDPCQGKRWSYEIDGVSVSDFCTPAYYTGGAAGERWSFRGAIPAARSVLKDGYVMWRVPEQQSWWRRDWMGAKLADYSLGPVPPQVSSLRGYVDRMWRLEVLRNRRTRQLALRKAAASRVAAKELSRAIERELALAERRRKAAEKGAKGTGAAKGTVREKGAKGAVRRAVPAPMKRPKRNSSLGSAAVARDSAPTSEPVSVKSAPGSSRKRAPRAVRASARVPRTRRKP